MRRIIYFVRFVIISLAAGIMVGCAQPVKPSALLQERVQTFLTELAQAEISALLTGDSTEYAKFFGSSIWPTSDTRILEYDPAVVAQFRRGIQTDGSDILDATTSAQLIEMKSDGEDWTIVYSIHDIMHYSVGGRSFAEPATRTGIFHAILQVSSDQIQIKAFR